MTGKTVKNVAASIRNRLLAKARQENRPFNELLQFYAMERFLYRLSMSPFVEKFVLKGALLLRVWQAPTLRPTMDIDMLGRTANEVEEIIECMRSICSVSVEADGLDFDLNSFRGERITEDADYEGVRIRFLGRLDTARVNIQIDIGFGDIVFPEPQQAELSTLLGHQPPRLFCYSRESAIAEKFEAMVKLGELNSRMKDFYDIWLLAGLYEFEGSQLAEAISRTFKNRGTAIGDDIAAFSELFSKAKAIQWAAFRRKLRAEGVPSDFGEVVMRIEAFLNPVAGAIRSASGFKGNWNPPGPWLDLE